MSNRGALHKLGEETVAAKALIEGLKAAELFGDDELVSDMIEGETNLFELIDEVVKKLGEDKANVEALKKYRQELSDRAAAIEAAGKKARAAMAMALDAIGKPSHRSAFGTISVKDGEPELILDQAREADIPKQFWDIPEPKPVLNKTRIREHLEQQEQIKASIAEAEKMEDGPEKSAILQGLRSRLNPIPGASLGLIKRIVSIRRR
jgi:hypothetical protein